MDPRKTSSGSFSTLQRHTIRKCDGGRISRSLNGTSRSSRKHFSLPKFNKNSPAYKAYAYSPGGGFPGGKKRPFSYFISRQFAYSHLPAQDHQQIHIQELRRRTPATSQSKISSKTSSSHSKRCWRTTTRRRSCGATSLAARTMPRSLRLRGSTGHATGSAR